MPLDVVAHSSADAVLCKATLRAAARLGINQTALSRVVGLSPASISRLASGQPIELREKRRECALMLVRVFRSLDALMGGDEAKVRNWFTAPGASEREV